jgi:hypothetical protein
LIRCLAMELLIIAGLAVIIWLLLKRQGTAPPAAPARLPEPEVQRQADALGEAMLTEINAAMYTLFKRKPGGHLQAGGRGV